MVRPWYRGLRLRPRMTLKLLWTLYCNYYHGLVSLWSHSLEKLWTTDTVLGSLGSALAAGTRCGQAETRDQSRPGAAYNGQTWPVSGETSPASPRQLQDPGRRWCSPLYMTLFHSFLLLGPQTTARATDKQMQRERETLHAAPPSPLPLDNPRTRSSDSTPEMK